MRCLITASLRATAMVAFFLPTRRMKVFGRLHDDPTHTRRRQAYEKRQWTKSREAARLRCSGLYEGLLATPTPMTDGMSGDEIDGPLKRVMPSPVWSSGQRTQPERAGTDLE